jgi:hypothetical protein
MRDVEAEVCVAEVGMVYENLGRKREYRDRKMGGGGEGTALRIQEKPL